MKQIISAEAWLINDKIYLRAYSQTVYGTGYSRYNPIYILTKDQFNMLGKKILETFKDCKMGVPHPDFTQKQPKDEMLITTGFKTDKALSKNGKAISVYLKDNMIKVYPWYFDGKHLTGSSDKDIYCSLDPDDITKTVLAAFERCHP